MEGNFPLDGKNRRLRLWRIPVFLSGAFLIGLCGFLRAVDSQTGSELVVLLLMGVVFCLAAVLSGLYNRKGYICLKNGRIQARYHWLGRLDCAIEDIAFVLPQINTLTILLKSGRRHIITGVADSWLLSRLIRRRLYAAERELPDSLRQELNLAKAKRAKTLTWVICGTAMLFVNILLTVQLTGGRELHEFSRLDWYRFLGMGFWELFLLVALLGVANQCGKQLFTLEVLRYRLRGALIAFTPLPTNHVRRVYTDENNSGRVVVCGFPNSKSVYYCVQEFSADEKLETVYSSQIFASRKELPEDAFSGLMDISFLFPKV